MKPTQAKQIALRVLQGNNTPFFLGGTGIGKSAIVESIAHEISGDRKLVCRISMMTMYRNVHF